MKIDYDKQIDAAYLSLADGYAAKTYSCDPDEVGGMINLDFDADGRLIGIEVIDASHLLPAASLKSQETIG